MVGIISTSRQQLQGQNTSVGIGLIELIESSDTLHNKPFFKYGMLQTIYTYSYCLCLCGTKSLVQKT